MVNILEKTFLKLIKSAEREGVEITSFSLKDYQTKPMTRAIIDYYKNTKIKRYSFQVGKRGKVINFTFII